MSEEKTTNLKTKILFSLFIFLFIASTYAQMPAEPGTGRPKIALALAGGGAYGLAHIGVIKIIEELGIPIDMVVGTSMGSIVGGFYAMGYDYQGLERIARETDWFDVLNEQRPRQSDSLSGAEDRKRYQVEINFDRRGFFFQGGLIQGAKILRFVDSLTLGLEENLDFDSLPRSYRAVATDLQNGQRVVLSRGSLSEAMRASMGIPGIFAPYLLDGKYLIDGGLVDNLPVDVAQELGADFIIAVDLFNSKGLDPAEVNRYPTSALSQTIDIILRSNMNRQKSKADLLISVDLKGYLPSDFNASKQIIAIGEEAGQEKMVALKELADSLHSYPSLPLKEPPRYPINAIKIQGVSEGEKALVHKIVAPLLGSKPDSEELTEIFNKLDYTGRFEHIRIRQDPIEGGAPLLVKLQEVKKEPNKLRLGFAYRTTMSDSITNDLDFSSSLLFNGLTTEDSQLRIDAILLDAPGFAINYDQDLGSAFRLNPFYEYHRNVTTLLDYSKIGIQYQAIYQKAGLNIFVNLMSGLSGGLGWSFEWFDKYQLPSELDANMIRKAHLLSSHLSYDDTDSYILPMQGLKTRVEASLSREEWGSELSFLTVQLDGTYFQKIGEKTSLGFAWKAASDLSSFNLGLHESPAFHKPNLLDRSLFPAPLMIGEQFSTDIAALGLELKHILNWTDNGVLFPSFLVISTAIAGLNTENKAIWNVDVLDSKACHWNTSAGLGFRFNDSFGLLLRAGLHRSMDTNFKAFVALDIGSIGAASY